METLPSARAMARGCSSFGVMDFREQRKQQIEYKRLHRLFQSKQEVLNEKWWEQSQKSSTPVSTTYRTMNERHAKSSGLQSDEALGEVQCFMPPQREGPSWVTRILLSAPVVKVCTARPVGFVFTGFLQADRSRTSTMDQQVFNSMELDACANIDKEHFFRHSDANVAAYNEELARQATFNGILKQIQREKQSAVFEARQIEA